MATYPRAGASEVPAQPDFPELEQRALAYWNATTRSRKSIANRDERQRVRLLRRPAVRQRPAALRPPADRLRQGHRAALQDDARREGGPAVRLGLPRPARRGRGRTAARHLRQGRHPQDGHRDVQRGLPRLRAALHQGVGGVRHPAGPLGRLRQRLQDARPPLHGERHVGVQAAARQGPDLPGLQGAALLLAVRDPAVQPRAADGRRRLRRPDRPVGHRPVQAGDRRVDPRLDHHAVDAAVQPGRRGRPGHHVRRPCRPPDGERYVLAKDRLHGLREGARRREDASARVRGSELLGRRYQPLFDYLTDTETFGTGRRLAGHRRPTR